MEIKSKWAAAVFIVMALVLALGMAVVAAPVKNGGEAEAATQQWSAVLVPNPMTLGFYPGLEITQLELSPNFNTDNTMYAITLEPGHPVIPPLGDGATFTLDDWHQLRKSTDGGYWWETLGIGLGAGMPAATPATAATNDGPWVIIDMAIAPDDPSYVVVACTDGDPVYASGAPTNIVYASSDGGATFGPIGAIPTVGAEYVTSIDVSPLVSGIHQIIVGVADNIGAVTTEGVYIWGAGSPPSLTWAPQLLVQDVYKVAFSSNYLMDFAIVVVGAVAAQFPPPQVAGDTWVHLRDTSDTVAPLWDDPVVFPGWPVTGVALWEGSATGAISPHIGVIVQADIALPDDFDATRSAKRVIYVSTAGGIFAGAPWVDDAWRITAATPWRLNVLGGASIPLSSLSHAGNISGGNLLAGGLGAGVGGYTPDIYTCTTPFSGTPMWYSASKPPTPQANVGLGWVGGSNTQVRAAPDYLTSGEAYCSTMGFPNMVAGMNWLDESAVSKTSDFGDTWNQIGLIDTMMSAGIRDVAPIAEDDIFFASVCGVTMNASLWRSVAGGLVDLSLWERVDMVVMPSGAPDIELSPDFATDNTVYWVDGALGVGGGTLIRVSQDGGAYFATRNALTPISDYVVEDANTIYYVDAVTATVYKSSDTGHTWPTTGVLPVAAFIIEQEPSTGALAVSGFGGVIALCSDTTTHPLSFLPIGIAPGTGALQLLAFSNEYDSDGLLYAADSGVGATGGVWTIAALAADQLDLNWGPIAGGLAGSSVTTAATGIAVTGDGTLYVADGTAVPTVGVSAPGVARTMNPTEFVIPGVEPQWVALIWGLSAGATLMGLETVSGSNVLFSIDTTTVMVTAMIPNTLVMFTDTLVAVGVTLVAPSDGSIAGVIEATLPMQFARVDFEWNDVADTHQYNIQVDTDSMFHNPWINAVVTAPDTTWISRLVLDPNTKFYWRVRVQQFITVAGASPWSAAWSFTTPAGEAVENVPVIQSPVNGQQDVGIENPCFTWGSVAGATEYKFTLKDSTGAVIADTTVTVTSYCYVGELEYESTYVWTVQGTSATTESGVASASFSTEAEAEPTPAWVWIIIAIGAVVAIVVIVLIVRTRRPV